ncbi:DNA translocase FtsK [Shewanella fidelis]|uniref:DNA translocase FtsK n=1 Tax=Shewanella fidelis TaxID=173509 RepID=A0AAW8NLY2_9GAMM|nr:DNA translocase FtsK 4TM domain-containing protein [Shewanella fidelis]MDR8523882.1 DNA translocase FtsK 4TM domain-containing protein [Shewanella fidelis]MDW4810429.1 DNA translocase FtsK 4TM domain-containing protein [Shewanella fidelis]MDW4814550.1 DNA translocase FtsK 4TM domain-containing protein [Shewanella fidelis]MDW4818640.1 DNA translocase FtsK 4TM domain-containing protein [Shewanella fidelis]MDW4823683.1 DNA translocase FtsK 4TM domain-containing protein [Shewanella fidelis]
MSKGNSVKTLSGIQRLLEGSLIICCMLATYVLIALSSFHSSDPGWSQSHFDGEIQNLTGAVGAWLADVLFYFFGYCAYIIPIIIALTGWLLFKRTHKLLEIDYFSVGLRLIGFLLIVLSLAALAGMNANGIYGFSAGGVAGDVIAEAMLPYFNTLGTTLLLLCFVGAGFTLLTGISWLTVIDLTGYATIWLFKSIRNLPSRFKPNIGDTEDTRGFMSVVERFKERRNADRYESEVEDDEDYASQAQNNDVAQKGQDKEPVTRVEPRVEPQILAKITQPESVDIKPQDEDVVAPWVSTSDDQDIEVIDFNNNASVGAEPVPTANKVAADDKVKIVDGIVVLPGQEEQPQVATTPLPCISLLDIPDRKKNPITEEELEQIGKLVEVKLADFNITANVVGVYPGPVVTRFELELAPGIKASKITNLSKDLARSLLAENVRVVEVIPGKAYVGLELPNKFRETVFMRDVLDCEAFREDPSHLSMVLGADIGGAPVVVDLGKMPHLLVAGTTGSGKSVGVNVMITSLLYKSGPDDVRFIMIDPKMLELSVYEGIPHLLCEVVTDMKEASNALRWCVGEMERRYKLMSALGVRNLKGYNAKIKDAKEAGQPIVDPLWKASDSMDPQAPELDKLPSIVVVVDEFADMMMIVGKKVEELIARIAQKARAAGIHLILATQRPSVDVITGLIKANIPTRMAFQVSSRIDSRTILDQQGAETLLGMGDMLYLPPGTSVPNRVHGAFIDDHEVHKVVADWCARGKPQYIDEILQGSAEGEQVLLPGETSESEEDVDALYDEAVAFVTQTRRGSISSVQRKFKIGYNRAARIIEQMEMQGVVSSQGHNGNREVLAPPPPKDYV